MELLPPFNTRSTIDLVELLEKNQVEFRRTKDSRIKELILSILKVNPWERPLAREILVDPKLVAVMRENGLAHKCRGHKRLATARNQ